MNLQPIKDKLIVQKHEPEKTTSSGLVLPTSINIETYSGTVVAVGPGSTTESGVLVPLQAKVGDVILFGKYAGQICKYDGVDLIVLKEDDIIAIVTQ